MKHNYPGFRIKQLTALVAVDEDGDEGIPAINGPEGQILPCVAADEKRLGQLMQIARAWVDSGQLHEVKVMRFTEGKVIEVIKK